MSDTMKSTDQYDAVLASLQQVISELLADRGAASTVEVTEAAQLYDMSGDNTPSLELDSLDALDIITALEDEYDVEVPDEIEFSSILTVGDVARLVTLLLEQR